MTEKKEHPFYECVNMVLRPSDFGYKNNVLIVKHNNAFIKREDMGDNPYYSYKKSKIRKPYEPFLDIIKEYVVEKIAHCKGFSLDSFLEKAKVYPLHKEVFKGYFTGQICERQEELLLGEYKYEKDKMKKAIVNMYSEIAKEKEGCLILDEINLASNFVIWMMEEISKNPEYFHIKVIGIYNEAGEELPFASDILREFIHRCEEEALVYYWLFEEEVDILSQQKEPEADIFEIIKNIKNMCVLLEEEPAAYYARYLNEQIEKYKINLNPIYKMVLLKVDYQISMMREEFAYALYLCNQMEKLAKNEHIFSYEERFEILASKTLVHMYSGNITQQKENIKACREILEERKDDKLLFKIMLIENMAKYNGWRNLWISENDTEVSNFLIEKCLEYKYINHLAHIFVYSFGSDYHKFSTIEGLEEKLPEFYKGIVLGERLQNKQFLIEAYQKNIMLASIHGQFQVSIYFYKKSLEVVKNSKNEIGEAGIYNGLGYSNCGIESYKKANDYYNKALIIYYKYQMPDEIVETLYNLGINATLAGEYKNASRYLMEADNILGVLKKSTLKTCDIAKLFGLIALVNFRQKAPYHTRLYLNKSKQYLGHILDKEDEEKIYIADDSMFLQYFVSGLIKQQEKNYEEAMKCFKKAKFYMKRSTGSMFFNYSEFIFDYYQLLMQLNREAEAQEAMTEFRQFCEENHYFYRLHKISEFLGAVVQSNESKAPQMILEKITLEDISKLMKIKAVEKEKQSLVNAIRFFSIIQKITSHMTRTIKEEVADMIPLFKNNFAIDDVFLIRCMENENEVVYSDLENEISKENIEFLVDYFKATQEGFVVSQDGMLHNEYKRVLSCFSASPILSFVAVPIFENEQLYTIFIAYIEIKNNWSPSKEKNILEERDLEIFTYIFRKISDAIAKLEAKNQLIKANDTMREQMQHVLELKTEAEVANISKSNFLANMSHEIRTPMNAIIGMAEIALQGELGTEQRKNIEQIYSSGKTLLSIINDILDFSKIESGKMDINVEKYQPLSIIHDIVNIINTRIGDKNLEFVVDVVPDLPYELLGDSIRIKQIIINLVNNAVKFTKQGMVKLKIAYEYINDEKIQLKIHVKDTGIGIKKQDIGKLFQAFQQVDSKRNRNIEGTGLGLAITKQLLALMGGEINVKSEYGHGTCFSCCLPQTIVTKKEMPDISNMEQIKAGIFIDNFYTKKQLKTDMKRLGVNCQEILSPEELLELIRSQIEYIFIEEKHCTDNILNILEKSPDTKGVLLTNNYITEKYAISNLITVKKPICSLELEKIFNHEDVYGTNSEIGENALDFIAPEAEILIVDDNSINLRVAEGLLKSLQVKIDTACSGKEAIDKISKKKYDIVFMDHMMPELDGVETTHIIRRFHEEYSEVPIIALTANAVSGTKEMFLSEGMNDFVAKPIEMKIIVSKIRQWLPAEKIKKAQSGGNTQEQVTNSNIQIEGLDVQYALSLVGEEKLFWLVLKEYYQAIEKKKELIHKYEQMEEWKAYTVEVHALKSASRQIGALELAGEAERMEKAGKEADAELIHKCTPDLLTLYENYQSILAPFFEQKQDKDTEKEIISLEKLKQLFEELREALDSLDMDGMERVMKKMDEYQYPEEQKNMYDQLKSAVEQIDSETSEGILQLWEKNL